MDVRLKPIDRIAGEIDMPGDKSISHRAAMIGAIAEGRTVADNFLTGEDCISTVNAFKKMNVDIKIDAKKMIVEGVGLRGLKKPEGGLFLGNSGTTMRLISGILAGQDFETTLSGDESLSQRPMERIIDPLKLMGAKISSVEKNGRAPIKIKGNKLQAITYKTKVASAQVKSCILLAGLYTEGLTQVEEPFQSRDHTERMLQLFGGDMKKDGLIVGVKSGGSLKGKKIVIPGDISSAAFFIFLATILKGSELTIKSLGINPTRRRLIDVLIRMGADLKVTKIAQGFEPICDLTVRGSELKGTVVTEDEIPQLIDEIPVLAVAAAQADGKTEIKGVRELKVKETDRVASIVDNLKKMGVDIKTENDNILISGSRARFKPASLESFDDHRTAMAMSVAALASEGGCVIKNTDCIDISFPGFFDISNFVKR